MVHDLVQRGLQQHQAGRLLEAKLLYQQVLAVEPRHPDACHLLGVIALQNGEVESAVALIEKAIQAQPGNPAFHANLAQALLALRRVAEAHAAFQRAAELDPHNPQFVTGAASCAAMKGDLGEAERQLRAIVQRHPGFALAWFNLGNTVREQGRPREAEDCFRRAITIEPGQPDAHNGLGSVLHTLGRLDDAERAYRQYRLLQPDAATGYVNLASVLIDRGRFDDAAAISRQGIERSHGPDGRPELHLMLGSALAYQGNFTAALGAFRAAATLAPDHARALWGCGLALLETGGEEEEALRWLERARELEPDSAEFRNAMAGVHLSIGNLDAGWREYGWRPARSRFVEKLSALQLVREAPGGVSGRSICVLREQGLGDELFFLRFATLLKARGAEITYCADAKIASMLERVAALDRVIVPNGPPPPADMAVLVGDLPQLLGRTESSPYPAPAASRSALGSAGKREMGLPRRLRVFFPELPPPLALVAVPQQLQQVKRMLAGLGPPPYLGLTWRAGTAPEQQRGAAWVLHKDVPLERLGSAVRGANATLLALQRNPKPGEIDEISSRAARRVHDVTALNEELEAILALLALIDDYAGVSNTNMHLRAGAGRTARVLVPRPTEWRWMISGDESPWFPGFRIYRQGADGDWGAAFDRLARDLQAEFGKP